MTAQDWIAAAIALLAFFWLLWRFGAMTGIRQESAASTSEGCAKCGSED
jgi:hypothetical protein